MPCLGWQGQQPRKRARSVGSPLTLPACPLPQQAALRWRLLCSPRISPLRPSAVGAGAAERVLLRAAEPAPRRPRSSRPAAGTAGPPGRGRPLPGPSCAASGPGSPPRLRPLRPVGRDTAERGGRRALGLPHDCLQAVTPVSTHPNAKAWLSPQGEGSLLPLGHGLQFRSRPEGKGKKKR